MTAFSYQETHGVIRRPGNLVQWSSEETGWSQLFASVQTEACYEGGFPAIRDHLLVIPLTRTVQFTRRIAGELQQRALPVGSLTITPGGADFQVRTRSDHASYDTVHLYLRHALLQETHDELVGDGDHPALQPSVAAVDPMIATLAGEIRRMLSDPAASDRLYVDVLSRTLAGCLIANHASGRRQRRNRNQSSRQSPRQIERAIDYIEASLDGQPRLTDIARAAGIGVARLTPEFKRQTGVTPYFYVVRARVQRAKHLLVSTDLPLADIALDCGFSHQQHMTRLVRRETGLTPGKIRRSR